MLKERARIFATAVFSLDLLLVALAFCTAHWLRGTLLPGLVERLEGGFYPLSAYLPLLPAALLVWAVALYANGVYRSARTRGLVDETVRLLRASAVAAALLVLVVYLFRLDAALLGDDRISRLWMFLFATLAALALVSERLALRIAFRYARGRGFNYRTVLLVGINPQAIDLARAVEEHPWWGFRILGFVAAEEPPEADGVAGYPVLGSLGELSRILEEQVVDEVVFAVGRSTLDRLEDIFLGLEELGIRTRIALNFFPHTQARVNLEDLDGLPLLTFSTAPSSPFQLLVKRVADVLVSLLVLVIALPLVVVIALLIRLTSRGSVLFRQTRCGLNGRRFTLYKFRTMVEGAEERRRELLHLNEMDGPAFKVSRDPRVTPIGRVLRKFSLDELPQLWNVLRGDMSLVGPRPPIPEEVAQYQRWQRRRLSMKPGLTCLWQISGRNQVDFDRWIELDLEYIDSWSPLLDLKILLKTIPVVLSGKGAS